MTTLDELAQIDGVVIAFEFAPDGKLLGHKGNAATSPETAALAAQFLCRCHDELQHCGEGPHKIEQRVLAPTAGLGLLRRGL